MDLDVGVPLPCLHLGFCHPSCVIIVVRICPLVVVLAGDLAGVRSFGFN